MANYITYEEFKGVMHGDSPVLDAGLDAFLAEGNYSKLDGSTNALAVYSTSQPYQYTEAGRVFMAFAIVARVGKNTFLILCNDMKSCRAFLREYASCLPLFDQLFTAMETSPTPALTTDETVQGVIARLDALEQATPATAVA